MYRIAVKKTSIFISVIIFCSLLWTFIAPGHGATDAGGVTPEAILTLLDELEHAQSRANLEQMLIRLQEIETRYAPYSIYWATRGRVLFGLNRAEQAEQAFQKALDEEVPYQLTLQEKAWVMHTLGRIAKQDRAQNAYSYFADSLKLAQAVGDIPLTVRNLNMLADQERGRGNFTAAKRYLDMSIEQSKYTYCEGYGYALVIKAETFMLEGAYTEAIRLCELAYDVRESLHDYSGMVYCLDKIAKAYSRVGNYIAAYETLHRQVALLNKKSDHEARAYCWLSLADLDTKIGEKLDAEAYLLAALNDFEEAHSYPGIARTWRELAEFYREKDLKVAFDAFAHSQAFTNPRNGVEIAFQAVTYGKLLKDFGNLQGALEAFSKARSLFETAHNAIEATWSQYNIGKTYYQLDEIESAEHELREALELFEKLHAPDRAAEVMLWLAKAESRLGDFDRAITHFQAARERFHETGMKRAEVEAVSGMAMTYKRMGQTTIALRMFRVVEEIFQSLGERSEVAFALNNQGITLNASGDYEHAESQFRKALQIFEQEQNETGKRYAYRGLGNALLNMGKVDSAIEAFQKALVIKQKQRVLSGEAYIYEALGRAYDRKGDQLEAERCFFECIDRAEQSGDEQGLLGGHIGLGLLYSKQNAREQAILHYTRAMEIIEHRRSKLMDEESQAFSSQQNIAIYNTLSRLHEQQQNVEEACVIWDKGRARSFLEQLEQAASVPQRAPYSALHQREIALKRILTSLRLILDKHIEEFSNQDRSSINNLLQQAGIELHHRSDGSFNDYIQNGIDLIESELQLVSSRIKSEDPAYAALADPEPLNIMEFQSTTLKPHEALLGYLIDTDYSLLFVMTSHELRSFRLPGRMTIETATTQFLSAVSRPITDPAARLDPLNDFIQNYPDMLTLFTLLVKPAQDFLADTTTLIIVPDGPLCQLPFAALVTEARDGVPQYLVQHYDIQLCPSASALRFLRERSRTDDTFSKQLLAIGNVNSHRLPPLSLAAQELNVVVSGIPAEQLTVLKGVQATEKNVKSLPLESFKWIYFGSHARVWEEHPLRSDILLSDEESSESTPEDGWLQAREILDLRVNAQLIVLSACNTAVGKQVAGEGLLSLTRTFFYAGAKRVVAGLSSVAEEPTMRIMEELFSNLPTQNPIHALNNAQRTLINDPNPLFRHPFCWSYFVVIGE